jgi:hypothetical protein
VEHEERRTPLTHVATAEVLGGEMSVEAPRAEARTGELGAGGSEGKVDGVAQVGAEEQEAFNAVDPAPKMTSILAVSRFAPCGAITVLHYGL